MGLSTAAVAPLDDLGWLDEAIGDARVVAIGESAHYNREFYELRHRLLRHLVERHGFTAYAMETGFVEAWQVDEWVRGGAGDLGDLMANGLTSLVGMWTPMRAHLEWMREHNRTAAQRIGLHGIDLPGSNASLLPGLEAVIAYLAEADPEYVVDPALMATATTFAAPSAFSAPTALAEYTKLPPETKDALTAGLARLAARMTGRRLDYLGRTSADAYERALRALRITVTLDAGIRTMADGDQEEIMYGRDAAIADTVEWVLRREDRILLGAHNGHVQRTRGAIPGIPPVTPMGMHLADRLGADYLVIGATSGTGQILNTGPDFYTGTLFTDMPPPEPGTLDALMNETHDEPFAVDLRRLSPADTDLVRAANRQRAGIGEFYNDQNALEAFDVVVHLPHVTGADPDQAAVAAAPEEVHKVFTP